MKSNKLLLLELIGGGCISWSIGIVLDNLLEVTIALDTIDKKLERLLNAPFKTAQRAFRLAKTHASKREFNECNLELERARKLFDDAASNSQGLEKVHSLYLAGLCCDLLKKNTKKKFYYKEAINTIDFFISTKSIEKQHHIIAATITGGGVGLAVGGYTLFWLLATIMWVPGVGIFSPFLFVGGLIGGSLISGGITSFTTRKITSLLEGNIKNKKFKSLDFTVEELKYALIKGKM